MSEPLVTIHECSWCGKITRIRAVLDGDQLCQACADDWARGQRDTDAADEQLTWDDL